MEDGQIEEDGEVRTHKSMPIWRAIVFVFAMSALGCASGPAKSLRGSGLEVGMTQEAVKALIGEPVGFHRRQIAPDDLREIWVYHVKNRNLLTRHLYPVTRLVVFSNGKVLAQDPHDPYAPRNTFRSG